MLLINEHVVFFCCTAQSKEVAWDIPTSDGLMASKAKLYRAARVVFFRSPALTFRQTSWDVSVAPEASVEASLSEISFLTLGACQTTQTARITRITCMTMMVKKGEACVCRLSFPEG